MSDDEMMDTETTDQPVAAETQHDKKAKETKVSAIMKTVPAAKLADPLDPNVDNKVLNSMLCNYMTDGRNLSRYQSEVQGLPPNQRKQHTLAGSFGDYMKTRSIFVGLETNATKFADIRQSGWLVLVAAAHYHFGFEEQDDEGTAEEKPNNKKGKKKQIARPPRRR